MIAALKPYPAYKNSGVPWLGSVPEHWELRRLKYLLQERDVRSTDGHEQLLRVSQFTGVTERKPADSGDVSDTRAESLVGYKRVGPNDLVVNIMLAWNGSMGISPFAGIASPAYCVYWFGPTAQPWYFHHLLRSPAYKARIKAVSTGVVESRLRLYTDDLYRLDALLPPLSEQTAIVRFLDHADRGIRRYIRAKQKLIKLLEEQKQAIIHSAVTRGLDPNVRLKPSGVEWLGDVPEHWQVRRLKAIVTESVAGPYGSSLTKSMYTSAGYRVYGQQQVISGNFAIGDYYISEKKYHEMLGYRVFPEDVLVSVMGTVGRVAVVPESAEPGIINPRLVRYRPDFSKVRPCYLQLVMLSPNAQTQLYGCAKGTTMEGLNMQILGRLWLAIPSLDEQDAILSAVAGETEQLQKAISSASQNVHLLREYRTRLIADVVTGKLDVREAAANLPDETDEPESLDETETSIEDDEETEVSNLEDVPEEGEA